MLLGVAPDRGQEPVAHHVGQGAVGEYVEGRPTLAVGPARSPKEGESSVDLTGEQQEHEERTEPPAPYGPLLQIHVLAAARPDPEEKGYGEKDEDDDEGEVHPPSSLLDGSKW